MPDYKTHIFLGIVFLITLFFIDKYYLHFLNFNLDWLFFAVYSPLIIFSFMLPDIDHPSSKPRFIITSLFLVMILFYALNNKIIYVVGLAFILLLIWTMTFFPGWEHRGHAHSIAFITFISLLVILINWKLAIIFWLGAFSHLLFDMEIKLW